MRKINRKTNVRKLVVTAMLSAFAAVLMFIEIPLPFIAPDFYKLDLSELPVIIGSFSLGPISGVIIELIKVLVHMVIKGPQSAFIGDLANLIVGCTFILPASIIYKHNKTKKTAVIGLIISTIFMAIVSVFLNAFLLLPAYSIFMPIEEIIELGHSIIPLITNKFTFCIFCVLPFNLIKGILVSVITILIYKPLSTIIHKKI